MWTENQNDNMETFQNNLDQWRWIMLVIGLQLWGLIQGGSRRT
jgi:hypothetical protein